MQYYQIEWDHEDFDEPWRLFLELDSHGALCRKVEVYRVGLYEPTDDINDPTPVDPQQLAGDSGNVTALTRVQFEDVWDQSREMPQGFMGMYY